MQALALDFLGVPAADTARRERRGLYSAATFGPPGKRLRVILLVGGRSCTWCTRIWPTGSSLRLLLQLAGLSGGCTC